MFTIDTFNLGSPLGEKSGLVDKLKGELPGILNWALQGCAACQEQGLNPRRRQLKLPAHIAGNWTLLRSSWRSAASKTSLPQHARRTCTRLIPCGAKSRASAWSRRRVSASASRRNASSDTGTTGCGIAVLGYVPGPEDGTDGTNGTIGTCQTGFFSREFSRMEKPRD
jgi:hypothetical protein